MPDVTRAVRVEFVYLIVAACVSASPVSGQRIAELASGPVRHEERSPMHDNDSTRTSRVLVVQGGVIDGNVRSGDDSAPFTRIPLDAPKRRCEAVFPIVAFGALAAIGAAAIAQVLPGSRPFREIWIPVGVGVLVTISAAAAFCNR